MRSKRRVVITGVGAVAPQAPTTKLFWDHLVAGKSGIRTISSFDVSGFKCQIGGEIDLADLMVHIRKGFKINRFGKNALFGVVASSFAIHHAGIDGNQDLPTVLGVSSSPFDVAAKHIRQAVAAPALVPAISPNSVALVLADYFGNTSRSLTTSTACAAGLDAVALAYERIVGGHEEIVLTGGADSSIAHHPFVDLDSVGMMSRRNAAPEKASRPFDRDRDGGLASEGAGMLILEDYKHAIARGAAIYAEIKGTGTSTDRKGAEHGSGLVDSMREALGNANLLESKVQYVNAHGSSDVTMDRVETQALKTVFGTHAKKLMVSSIKGVTGNPLAAGGPLQVVASTLCIHEGTVHPTANYQFPDPDCDLDYVPKARRVRVENIVVNSHGVGGGNVSLVMGRFVR